MRGADGSGRDGFIFRPAHEGRLAAGKGMVASSGWAGEKHASGWFPKHLPAAQWQQTRARKQHAIFMRLFQDGEKHQTHIAERHVLPLHTREISEEQVSLASWNPWSPAQLSSNNERASRFPVSPIKRPSFLVDKHTGGVGGILCMQQPSSRRDGHPSVANTENELEQKGLMTTPRRPVNYFNLPSLSLKNMHASGGLQTARERLNVESAAKDTDRAAGAETARERAKVALAAESIVNSLTERFRQNEQANHSSADPQHGKRTGKHTAQGTHSRHTAGSQVMSGAGNRASLRDRSTMQLQMQLQA